MGGDNTYRFIDLVDVPAFTRLLERFYQATGIPNGVVDANGELLSMSSGANVCAVFHRTHSESAEFCRDSNLELMQELRDGCVAGGLCRNGLMDYATPVMIEGQQLATLFLGQVLHSPPDMECFRAQAVRFGFDEKAYLDAIAAIPVIDKEHLDDLMDVMVEMAQMLAASGLARLRQTELEHDISIHAQRNIQLKDILDFSPVAMGWSENEDRIEYVNRQFIQLFGYTLDDLPDLESWYRLAYPDDGYRQAVIVPWRKAVRQAQRDNVFPPELEANITCKNGTQLAIIVRVAWVGHHRMVSFTDITERKRIENALRRSQEMLADAQRLALLGSWDWNIVDDRVEWSQMACEIYTPDEYPIEPSFENFKSSLHPADRDMVVAAVQSAFEHDTPFDLDHRVVSVSKGVRTVHAQGKVFRDAEGRPIRMMGTVQDISERKRMEQALVAREREFRTLAEHLPDFMVRYDRDARFVYVNPRFEALIGFSLAEVRGKTPTQIRGLPEAKFFEQKVRKVVETGKAIEFEHEVLTLDESEFYGWVSITPEFDEAGQVEYIQVVTRDITERKHREQRTQTHDALLEMVARGTELDEILNALVLNIESEDKTSLCSVMLVDAGGKHLLARVAPNLPKFYSEAINGLEICVGSGSCGTAAALGERVIVEDVMTHSNWKLFRGLAQQAGLRACWSEPILSSRGKVLGTFGVYYAEPKSPQLEDIERIDFAANLAAIAIENRQVRDELECQAHSDYLTGLDNRRHFLSQAENELARTRRYGRELSILMLDVDHFKQVNDTYGHKVGDLVLKRLSELCAATLRNIDIIGRIGGEEFAVLLPETGSECAMETAERLRLAIAATQVKLDSGLPLRFTASFGVTTLHDKDANIDMLMNQADQALYQAKNEGRNRVCLYPVANEAGVLHSLSA